MTLAAALGVIGGALAVVELVKTKGQSLCAWSALALAAAVVIAH